MKKISIAIISLLLVSSVAHAADISPPTIPTGLTVSQVTSSSIKLSWNPSVDDVGVVGYRILRCAGTCTPFTTLIDTGSTATTYTDSGLPTNTTYSYRVRAYDAVGNMSAYSSTVTSTTLSRRYRHMHMFGSMRIIRGSIIFN